MMLERIITKIKYGLIYKVRALFYLGNKIMCPCCGGHFRKFISFGINKRPNAMCPRCGSLERQRLIWLYLRDKILPLYQKPKLLHIGPEYSIQKNISNIAGVNYISIDLKSPLAMKKMDVMDMIFENNTFDIVVCLHVLEHVEDDKKALKEIYRVLKQNGCMINQSPIDLKRDKTLENKNIVSSKERENFFWQKDHVRLYGCDYKNLLENAGFIVKTENAFNIFNQETIKHYGLTTKDNIYLCVK